MEHIKFKKISPLNILKSLFFFAFFFVLVGCGLIRQNSAEHQEFPFDGGKVIVDTYYPSTCRIQANGAINASMTKLVAAGIQTLNKANCQTKRLTLVSQGGSIKEALEIGRLIHAEKYDTSAPAQCDSACTLIFIAGRERELVDNYNFGLGFHQARNFKGECVSYDRMNADPAVKQNIAAITKYTNEMLPNPAAQTFLRSFMSASCDIVNRMNPSEAVKSGIATASGIFLWQFP